MKTRQRARVEGSTAIDRVALFLIGLAALMAATLALSYAGWLGSDPELQQGALVYGAVFGVIYCLLRVGSVLGCENE